MKIHRQDFMDTNGVVQAEVTQTGIYGLFGVYRCLSNFHAFPFEVDGVTYQCSEAAYMAQKTDDTEVKKLFVGLSGKEAKVLGQQIQLKPFWNDIRIHAMYKVLLAKFAQDKDSCGVLVATGNHYIEETNWWGDQFWGVCRGRGTNHLGQILMTIRGIVR
jgi:ribA/ribD-fused uncharacterized protein